MPATRPIAPLASLLRDVRRCTACGRMDHTHAAPALPARARPRVLFVAEAPGRRGAALTGVPLTRDEAGRRFDGFLALAGIPRGAIAVTNAVLCNPLDDHGRNRAPTAGECARCRPFLARTIGALDPAVVVALGGVALRSLGAIAPHGLELRRDAGLPAAWYGRTVVALYHPARRSTLHRDEERQRDDWRRLGATLRRLVRDL